MDYSPPGSAVQARILEWVAISFSRRSSWARDRTFCLSLFLIEEQLLYDIVLVSAIHQHESAICPLLLEPASPPTLSHLSMLSQSPSLSSLSYTANSHLLDTTEATYQQQQQQCICSHATFSIHPTLSCPTPHIHKSEAHLSQSSHPMPRMQHPQASDQWRDHAYSLLLKWNEGTF